MTDNEIIQQYKKYEPFFGSWYIKRFIGEGGFAKVFEITRNDFGDEYTSALKIITVSKTKSEIITLRSEGMSDNDIREYLRGIMENTVSEIKLMYKLRGKGNIVSYEDHAVVEHEDGMGWDILIKMEYLTSLSNYVYRQKGRLAKRDIIKLGVDICKSLEYCQRYNIIHRDIKADNIFISDDGEFKLGDFGIARVIERKDQTLSKKGTSAYMAPEVYKGQTYTSAVDIYSLGMVMYRLMNNNRGPFLPPYPQPMSLDDRDHAMMLRMSGEKFPKPSQVTRGRLVEIVLKACSYKPEKRYSSPVAMRQELEAIYLDADEMTTEEWVMIYDAEGKSSISTSSTGQSSIPAKSPKPAAATEVLREESATEALREDVVTEALRVDDATEAMREDVATEALRKENVTEVLREEDISAVQSEPAKILCRKCGSAIRPGIKRCTVCGAAQKKQKPPKESYEPKDQEQPSDKTVSKRNIRKPIVIGGVCAAVLLMAAVIGVALYDSSDDKNTDPSGQYTVQQTAEPTEQPQKTSEPTQEPQMPWSENILMKVTGALGESTAFLGSEIKRETIVSIIFLDTLDSMPSDAWDVSVDGSGKVMAWAVPRGDYYDLYIGGKGGVSANEDSRNLFRFMTRLETIQFNGCFHTESAANMNAMFSDCKNLMSMDLSGFDTSNVKEMSNMFSNCESLLILVLSGFDTSNVTNMGYMFESCRNVTNLNLSGFDTSNVTNMKNMFHGCYDLVSLDLSSFDTVNVKNMREMFSDCSSLGSLDLSGFNTSSVTDMQLMFAFSAITSLDLSGFDTPQETNTRDMFYQCFSLSSLNLECFTPEQIADMSIPDGVTIN